MSDTKQPTPRTDERATNTDYIRADFARTLERELAAALAERDALNNEWNERYCRMQEVEERLTRNTQDLAELQIKAESALSQARETALRGVLEAIGSGMADAPDVRQWIEAALKDSAK